METFDHVVMTAPIKSVNELVKESSSTAKADAEFDLFTRTTSNVNVTLMVRNATIPNAANGDGTRLSSLIPFISGFSLDPDSTHPIKSEFGLRAGGFAWCKYPEQFAGSHVLPVRFFFRPIDDAHKRKHVVASKKQYIEVSKRMLTEMVHLLRAGQKTEANEAGSSAEDTGVESSTTTTASTTEDTSINNSGGAKRSSIELSEDAKVPTHRMYSVGDDPELEKALDLGNAQAFVEMWESALPVKSDALAAEVARAEELLNECAGEEDSTKKRIRFAGSLRVFSGVEVAARSGKETAAELLEVLKLYEEETPKTAVSP